MFGKYSLLSFLLVTLFMRESFAIDSCVVRPGFATRRYMLPAPLDLGENLLVQNGDVSIITHAYPGTEAGVDTNFPYGIKVRDGSFYGALSFDPTAMSGNSTPTLLPETAGNITDFWSIYPETLVYSRQLSNGVSISASLQRSDVSQSWYVLISIVGRAYNFRAFDSQFAKCTILAERVVTSDSSLLNFGYTPIAFRAAASITGICSLAGFQAVLAASGSPIHTNNLAGSQSWMFQSLMANAKYELSVLVDSYDSTYNGIPIKIPYRVRVRDGNAVSDIMFNTTSQSSDVKPQLKFSNQTTNSFWTTVPTYNGEFMYKREISSVSGATVFFNVAKVKGTPEDNAWGIYVTMFAPRNLFLGSYSAMSSCNTDSKVWARPDDRVVRMPLWGFDTPSSSAVVLTPAPTPSPPTSPNPFRTSN